MRKLNGFTLAEVLITLSIIGIIASVTLPALNANIQAQKAGPALAKAVNTLSNANKLALAENDARSLTDISSDYLDVLQRYVPGTSDGSRTYIANDGIAYTVGNAYSTKTHTNANNLAKYNGKYVNVDVDINGPSKPNTMGRDQFKLIVDGRGSVMPYGGREHATYMEAAQDNAWVGTCDKTKFTNGENCAGSIADNGWKVIYK